MWLIVICIESDLISNSKLQEERVCFAWEYTHKQWEIAGGHRVSLLKQFGVRCLSDAERLLIINVDVARRGCLQPTALMIRWLCNILNFTPLNRHPPERLLGHRCWQSGRRRELDIRPERRGRGEGEEKTGPVKQKERKRKKFVCLKITKQTGRERGMGEFGQSQQRQGRAYSIPDSQQHPEAFHTADTGALKSKHWKCLTIRTWTIRFLRQADICLLCFSVQTHFIG